MDSFGKIFSFSVVVTYGVQVQTSKGLGVVLEVIPKVLIRGWYSKFLFL